MKIIYHCYGGAHSSITAAAVHLGWLPTDRVPTSQELKNLPYFDRPTDKDHGHIRFMGQDDHGNAIYVLGRRNNAAIFAKMGRGLAELFGFSETDLQLIDVMPYVNWKMVVGGFTSRKLGIVGLGRPIIIAGVKYSFWPIVNLVHRVKYNVVSEIQ